MVLLMAASVVVMPLALPLFVKGVQVNPWQIAAPLVVLMLARSRSAWQRAVLRHASAPDCCRC